MMTQFPHLTDTESVRQEAAKQYGGLSDAAAFQQSHRASLDPNVAAASLRHRNAEETAEVQNDLSLAQEKIDDAYGEGTYRVIDAAVRGDALSVVAEDGYGRPTHLVVGWTDAWRSISPKAGEAEARANAEAEAAKGRLGAEARAEVARLVKEATDKIMEQVSGILGDKLSEVNDVRDQAVQDALDNAGGDDDGKGSGPASAGSPSSTEGNDTSEKGAGKTQGSETGDDGDDGDDGDVKFPRTHEALDKLGKDNGVEFDQDDNVATKQEKLREAGVKPDEE